MRHLSKGLTTENTESTEKKYGSRRKMKEKNSVCSVNSVLKKLMNPLFDPLLFSLRVLCVLRV
jgi:hypothetical protein